MPFDLCQNYEGDALQKVMGLINALMKQANAYEELDCDVYLRIYVLCVHPSYLERDLEAILLKTCIELTSSLNLPAIGAVFSSGTSQSLALSLGFHYISKIHYSRWLINDEIVFDDPGRGNYSAAFMGMHIESETSRESADDSAATNQPLAN